MNEKTHMAFRAIWASSHLSPSRYDNYQKEEFIMLLNYFNNKFYGKLFKDYSKKISFLDLSSGKYYSNADTYPINHDCMVCTPDPNRVIFEDLLGNKFSIKI